jgi:2-polyprenyl-3-methyl-5-hydroxy-6-metoxy-1,4-benzoquinol methylase
MTEAAKKAGWDSIGIDLNQSAVEFGAARGLKLRFGDLFDFKFDTGSFDVVTLFDVLEHLVSPRKVVEEAARILRPGGLLFIFVPNWDSASRVLMGEQAHFIWPTHHLTYFTPTTLSNFITGLGLNIELLVTEGLDIFDYLWAQEESGTHDTAALRRIANELQFFINAGAWGKNLRCLARRT